jgi:mono/diheme cytochrome c family protein
LAACAVVWLATTALVGAEEVDIATPRVPPEELAAAEKLANPVEASPPVLARGKELYTLACVACHGVEGRGDGPLTEQTTMRPSPRNFTNPEFQRLRSDGELYWVLNHGIHESQMMRMDFFFTDNELWTLVRYLRTLGAP